MENSKNTKQLVYIAIIVVIVIIGICVFSMNKEEETVSNNITNVQQDNSTSNTQGDTSIVNDAQEEDIAYPAEIEPQDSTEEELLDIVETPSEGQSDM
jgi:hypothetical protein